MRPASPAAHWLDRHWPLLHRVAQRILPTAQGAQDAEDAVIQAALAIWQHWPDCRDDPAERRRWATTITKRKALDVRKAQQREAVRRVWEWPRGTERAA